MRRKSREYYHPSVIQPVGSPHGLFVVLELDPLVPVGPQPLDATGRRDVPTMGHQGGGKSHPTNRKRTESAGAKLGHHDVESSNDFRGSCRSRLVQLKLLYGLVEVREYKPVGGLRPVGSTSCHHAWTVRPTSTPAPTIPISAVSQRSPGAMSASL